MAENQNNATEGKRRSFVDFVERNSEWLLLGGLLGTVLLWSGGSYYFADRQNKRTAELNKQCIDAELEAAKYKADKEAEVELAKTGDIKAIVHDITTLKESH